jgi:hypothetical protein
MSLPTTVPGAQKIFGALNGQEFADPAAFSDAYYRTVRQFWGSLGTAFATSDALDWALTQGVVRREGERVIVAMTPD